MLLSLVKIFLRMYWRKTLLKYICTNVLGKIILGWNVTVTPYFLLKWTVTMTFSNRPPTPFISLTCQTTVIVMLISSYHVLLQKRELPPASISHFHLINNGSSACNVSVHLCWWIWFKWQIKYNLFWQPRFPIVDSFWHVMHLFLLHYLSIISCLISV